MSMNKRLVKKKGISPVIASVLLVVVVVVLATIIFIWARSFIKEAIKKNELTAEQACSEIKFDASLSLVSDGAGGSKVTTVDVVNKANIALYQFNIQKIGEGRSDVEHVSLQDGLGLNGGEGTSFVLQVNYTRGSTTAVYQQLHLIPEILGTSNQAKKIFTCPEKYGLTLDVS